MRNVITESAWWQQQRKPEPAAETHFLDVPEAVEIGYEFENEAGRWRVTWCQPNRKRVGFKIMVMKI